MANKILDKIEVWDFITNNKSYTGTIEDTEGTTRDFVNGELHGVVAYKNGAKKYYKEGNKHRIDGPAEVSADGSLKKYFIDGIQYDDYEKWKRDTREMKLDAFVGDEEEEMNE